MYPLICVRYTHNFIVMYHVGVIERYGWRSSRSGGHVQRRSGLGERGGGVAAGEGRGRDDALNVRLAAASPAVGVWRARTRRRRQCLCTNVAAAVAAVAVAAAAAAGQGLTQTRWRPPAPCRWSPARWGASWRPRRLSSCASPCCCHWCAREPVTASGWATAGSTSLQADSGDVTTSGHTARPKGDSTLFEMLKGHDWSLWAFTGICFCLIHGATCWIITNVTEE